MNVLVVGGAGYIGAHTVQALRERGHKVFVYDNLSTGNLEAVPEDVHFFEGDIRDGDFLRHIFAEYLIDAVVHFAACSLVGESMQDPAKYYNNNVVGTLSLLNAMKGAGVEYLLFSSTAAVYGEPTSLPITETALCQPTNVYGRTKLAIEWSLADYAQAYNLKYTALRYFNAAGASLDASIGEAHPVETHLIPLILQAVTKHKALQVFGDDYPTPDGTCIRDYIHVLDLATAHVLALEKMVQTKQSAVYNLGTETGFSVLEIIKMVEQVTGLEVPYTISPRRAGDPARLVASVNKAKQQLGWQLQHSDLQQIISSAWQWHCK